MVIHFHDRDLPDAVDLVCNLLRLSIAMNCKTKRRTEAPRRRR